MTADEELRAALAPASLEVWLDTRCGLGERAYLDWARAAIAAAAEVQEIVPDARLARIQASAATWAASPTREHADETTRLALEAQHEGPVVSPAQRAVMLAAATIDSLGASWRENAELAIGEARRALRERSEDEASVQARLARALVHALRAPAPEVLPRPRESVRPAALTGSLPPLPTGWRWHADFDPTLARHTRAIARERSWPVDADRLDGLLASVVEQTRASPSSWTLERRASGELEAHTMIEVLDPPDRAHVRISLLRDRRRHESITLACIGAETTGAVEALVATALDRALDPVPGTSQAPARVPRARRTSASDLGRRVLESFVATAEGRPALPLGWRWTASGSARTERSWPRATAETEALLDAAAAILVPAGPARWTRTWRAGGPVLLRATLRAGLDEAAIDVRFADSRGARTQADLASVEVRALGPGAVASVADALHRASDGRDAV